MDWKTLLTCITGSVEEQLLLRNEYVVEENRILRNQIAGRVQLTDAERQTLAAIGKKLGKQALEEVATIVKPDTILAWHRKLVAQKFDGSEQRKSVGRPRVDKEIEDLVVQMAKENRGWGYDRIVGALAELGYDISDQSVGNILKRRGQWCKGAVILCTIGLLQFCPQGGHLCLVPCLKNLWKKARSPSWSALHSSVCWAPIASICGMSAPRRSNILETSYSPASMI